MAKLNMIAKRKLAFILICIECFAFVLIARIFYIQSFSAEELQTLAYEQQTRDRLIKPNRGTIYDRNMVGIAQTETVASISVIHSQVKDEEETARVLSTMLELDYEYVLKKVQNNVALERIKTKVEKNLADEIRALNISGVVVDEDIKRVYPYSNLASQVIGFVGSDNQGIIGLEAKYDEYLSGESGKILTETDAKGRSLEDGQSERLSPTDGYHLVTTIDVIIQQYAEQTLEKVLTAKNATRGSIILLNPQNGEIYAMANKPDFDLNDPFTINSTELQFIWEHLTASEQQDYLNQMWRNFSINDTYEPGSTFKVFTSVAGLEEGLITENTTFECNSGRTIAGRLIKCWRSPNSHGTQTFAEGVQNSCNPVFMDLAEEMGADTFYDYVTKFGFNEKTGIDLPGEASGILHKLENIGPLELATMSFGQSFQITPIQLLSAASATINGGYEITPHFAKQILDDNGNIIHEFDNSKGEQIISTDTSDLMREILESVVYEGTGSKTYIPGYKIGGKTATSEKLPRGDGNYIASFMAFAPADDPQVIALVLIDEPEGTYYGGQVAGPVMQEVLSATLPYLNVEPNYNDVEIELPETQTVIVPNLLGLSLENATKKLSELGLVYEIKGQGDIVSNQFPFFGDEVNLNSKIMIELEYL